MNSTLAQIQVRNTTPGDIAGIIELCKAVYPDSPPWGEAQLRSHQDVFPEGQFVAIDTVSGHVVGMAASLIILWDDYEMNTNWRDFTAGGYFINHDPVYGRTLYGAEVMVHPNCRGRGVGKQLYQARRELTERLGLLRIRAGARLANYHRHSATMSATEYTKSIVNGEMGDPTLTFQLRQDFQVLAVVGGYLRNDPESLGYAAVIEWLNTQVATPADYAARAVFPTHSPSP